MCAKKKVGSAKGSYLHVTWILASMRDRCLQGYVFVLAAVVSTGTNTLLGREHENWCMQLTDYMLVPLLMIWTCIHIYGLSTVGISMWCRYMARWLELQNGHMNAV
jgi:hypothetical protein